MDATTGHRFDGTTSLGDAPGTPAKNGRTTGAKFGQLVRNCEMLNCVGKVRRVVLTAVAKHPATTHRSIDPIVLQPAIARSTAAETPDRRYRKKNSGSRRIDNFRSLRHGHNRKRRIGIEYNDAVPGIPGGTAASVRW